MSFVGETSPGQSIFRGEDGEGVARPTGSRCPPCGKIRFFANVTSEEERTSSSEDRLTLTVGVVWTDASGFALGPIFWRNGNAAY
jgi:hypothetical protein